MEMIFDEDNNSLADLNNKLINNSNTIRRVEFMNALNLKNTLVNSTRPLLIEETTLSPSKADKPTCRYLFADERLYEVSKTNALRAAQWKKFASKLNQSKNLNSKLSADETAKMDHETKENLPEKKDIASKNCIKGNGFSENVETIQYVSISNKLQTIPFINCVNFISETRNQACDCVIEIDDALVAISAADNTMSQKDGNTKEVSKKKIESADQMKYNNPPKSTEMFNSVPKTDRFQNIPFIPCVNNPSVCELRNQTEEFGAENEEEFKVSVDSNNKSAKDLKKEEKNEKTAVRVSTPEETPLSNLTNQIEKNNFNTNTKTIENFPITEQFQDFQVVDYINFSSKINNQIEDRVNKISDELLVSADNITNTPSDGNLIQEASTDEIMTSLTNINIGCKKGDHKIDKANLLVNCENLTAERINDLGKLSDKTDEFLNAPADYNTKPLLNPKKEQMVSFTNHAEEICEGLNVCADKNIKAIPIYQEQDNGTNSVLEILTDKKMTSSLNPIKENVSETVRALNNVPKVKKPENVRLISSSKLGIVSNKNNFQDTPFYENWKPLETTDRHIKKILNDFKQDNSSKMVSINGEDESDSDISKNDEAIKNFSKFFDHKQLSIDGMVVSPINEDSGTSSDDSGDDTSHVCFDHESLVNEKRRSINNNKQVAGQLDEILEKFYKLNQIDIKNCMYINSSDRTNKTVKPMWNLYSDVSSDEEIFDDFSECVMSDEKNVDSQRSEGEMLNNLKLDTPILQQAMNNAANSSADNENQENGYLNLDSETGEANKHVIGEKKRFVVVGTKFEISNSDNIDKYGIAIKKQISLVEKMMESLKCSRKFDSVQLKKVFFIGRKTDPITMKNIQDTVSVFGKMKEITATNWPDLDNVKDILEEDNQIEYNKDNRGTSKSVEEIDGILKHSKPNFSVDNRTFKKVEECLDDFKKMWNDMDKLIGIQNSADGNKIIGKINKRVDRISGDKKPDRLLIPDFRREDWNVRDKSKNSENDGYLCSQLEKFIDKTKCDDDNESSDSAEKVTIALTPKLVKPPPKCDIVCNFLTLPKLRNETTRKKDLINEKMKEWPKSAATSCVCPNFDTTSKSLKSTDRKLIDDSPKLVDIKEHFSNPNFEENADKIEKKDILIQVKSNDGDLDKESRKICFNTKKEKTILKLNKRTVEFDGKGTFDKFSLVNIDKLNFENKRSKNEGAIKKVPKLDIQHIKKYTHKNQNSELPKNSLKFDKQYQLPKTDTYLNLPKNEHKHNNKDKNSPKKSPKIDNIQATSKLVECIEESIEGENVKEMRAQAERLLKYLDSSNMMANNTNKGPESEIKMSNKTTESLKPANTKQAVIKTGAIKNAPVSSTQSDQTAGAINRNTGAIKKYSSWHNKINRNNSWSQNESKNPLKQNVLPTANIFTEIDANYYSDQFDDAKLLTTPNKVIGSNNNDESAPVRSPLLDITADLQRYESPKQNASGPLIETMKQTPSNATVTSCQDQPDEISSIDQISSCSLVEPHIELDEKCENPNYCLDVSFLRHELGNYVNNTEDIKIANLFSIACDVATKLNGKSSISLTELEAAIDTMIEDLVEKENKNKSSEHTG